MSAPQGISGREELPQTSRYELLVKIASGGMATVYVGRLRGVEGFSRQVAIKRAHPHLVEDPAFRRMLIAEARLAARIHHPNVVSVQDVDEADGELLLAMDYVEGAALSSLLGAAIHAERPLPPAIAVRVILDAALGLHAAHTLTDEEGHPLGLVHRDVSPHNILVGLDGVARITDFGIAKCMTSNTAGTATATGVLKGKLAYMAPEYVEHGDIDARGDVFARGVVLCCGSRWPTSGSSGRRPRWRPCAGWR
jgi:serine/threonine-protein kinase